MQFDGQLGTETESSETWSADCMYVIGCFSGSMTSCKNLRYTGEVRACVRACMIFGSFGIESAQPSRCPWLNARER